MRTSCTWCVGVKLWMSRGEHVSPTIHSLQGKTWRPFSPANLFVFCLQQQTFCMLNDHCSGNGHVSLINSNSSPIAHSLGDIEYLCVMKKTMWAPPSLFAIANTPICRLLPFSERSLRTVVQ